MADLMIERIYQQRLLGKSGPYPVQTAMAAHLPYLRRLVIETHAQLVIEIGVYTGQSTVAFLSGLQETGGWLWSCDIKEPQEPIAALRGRPDWIFALGPSAKLAPIAPNYADILLIDGDLKERMRDLQNYGPRVRLGGWILVHDTERKPVRLALAAYCAETNQDWQDDPAGRGMGRIYVAHH